MPKLIRRRDALRAARIGVFVKFIGEHQSLQMGGILVRAPKTPQFGDGLTLTAIGIQQGLIRVRRSAHQARKTREQALRGFEIASDGRRS